MSGGTSTLWRASLCSVVMALTVLGTGCAIENVDAGDPDEDTAEALADLTVNVPKPSGGLKAPKDPIGGAVFNKLGGHAKSPTRKLDEVAEPEPEPWHPDGRGGSGDPDDVKLSPTPDRSDDNK